MKRLILAFLTCLMFVSTASAQFLADAALDAALDEIATGTAWHFCSQLPTNFTEATSTYSLGSTTVTAGDGNGDYTIADDGTNGGRKLTLVGQAVTTLTANGTATHQCVVTGSVLLGCLEINGGTGRTITDYTTESWDSADAEFQMRDIQ